MTTPAVTIRQADRRRFAFACTCGWRGDTDNMSRAAQPIAEHLRVCTGKPPFSRKPYRPEQFDGRPTAYPKPPAEED